MKKILSAIVLAVSVFPLFSAENSVALKHLEDIDESLYVIQDKPNKMNMKIFSGVSEELKKKYAPDGTSDSSVNVYLIKPSENEAILIDAGVGTEAGGKLLDGLAKLNIKKESVKAVLLTHMHFDHTGELLDKNSKPVFPNANIYVNKNDIDYFVTKNKDPFASKIISAYGDKVKTFTSNEIVLPDNIKALENFSGHTPGHTLYSYKNVIFAGDILHAAALQIPEPAACASYDVDPEKSVAARIALYKMTELNSDMTKTRFMAGAHIPFPGIGATTKNDDDKYSFVTEKEYFSAKADKENSK